MADLFRALRSRNFAFLFSARTASAVGSAMAPIALAFAVLGFSGPTALGLVLISRQVPNVLFMLVAGVVADRLSRGTVIAVVQTASGLAQVAAAALVGAGIATVPELAGLACINGACSAFSGPATSGLIRSLVPSTDLRQANALLNLSMNFALIGGTALGGILVAAGGADVALYVDGGTFILSALLHSRITIAAAGSIEAGTLFSGALAGIREFLARRWLLYVGLLCGAINMVYSGAIGVVAPAVLAHHASGPRLYGLAMTGEAVGFVLGSLVTSRWEPRHLLAAGISATLLIIPLLLLFAESSSLLILVPAAVLSGVGLEVFTVFWAVCLQACVPEALTSRIAACDAVVSFAAAPIGTILIPVLGTALGARAALEISAAVVLCAVLGCLAVRSVRDVALPEEVV